jgi:pimeloyl-ACP methyl ester carboxylesterase
MRPVLIPLAERLGRRALRKRGVRTRWEKTPLGRVHVYDAPGHGTLPTTVLLHGVGSSATPFGPLLARLRRRVRRVVAPDYPGHGFSPPPVKPMHPDALLEAMTQVLDETLDEPAVLVGNSLGGGIALHYASVRPARVRALVLLSPAGARATDEEWHALRKAFDLRTRADAIEFLGRVYHRTPWLARVVAHEVPRSVARRAVRELLASANNDHAATPEALAGLTMPILLVWGRSERLLPDTHLAYFRAHLPKHAIVERPEGFGHCPHVDAPEAVARRIVEFVEKETRTAK